MDKSKLKRIFKSIFIVILCLAVAFVALFAATCIAGFVQVDKNIEYQENYLEYLKNEYYTELYIPCDEQQLADFDIAEAYLNAELGSGYEWWHNFYEFHKLAIDELEAFDYESYKANGFKMEHLGDYPLKLEKKPEA